MGSITNYAEDALLNHVFNGVGYVYTPASVVYAVLSTADPTDAATGASCNEVANSGNYARAAITFNAASSRAILNQLCTFNQASGAWGTVTHWCIADTGTYGSGNILAHGQFVESKAVVSGNTPSIAASEIDVTFNAGYGTNYLANTALDFMFRNQAFAQPATWLLLTTATISDSDTGSSVTEPSGNGYVREQVNDNGGSTPTWTVGSGGAITTAHQVEFGPASGGAWGTIVASGVADASSGGNLLCYDNAVTDQAVGDGDTPYFAAGDWDITLD